MGYLLVVVGTLAAIYGYGNALPGMADVQSAIHQQLIALWMIIGTLGLVLVGLGGIVNALKSGAAPAQVPIPKADPSDTRPYPERLKDWKKRQREMMTTG